MRKTKYEKRISQESKKTLDSLNKRLNALETPHRTTMDDLEARRMVLEKADQTFDPEQRGMITRKLESIYESKSLLMKSY